MMRHRLTRLAAIWWWWHAHYAHAAPSVLNAGFHAGFLIGPGVDTFLGAGKVDGPIFVDVDPAGTATAVVANSSNTTAQFVSDANPTGPPVNHAIYQTLNASLCCYQPDEDRVNYPKLVLQGTLFVHTIAVTLGGALPVGTPPPTIEVTVSSPDPAGSGASSWGMEFGISAHYKGLNTTAESWVSADMAAMLVSLQYNHPTLSIFDLKGSLRQTASNWPTYSAAQYGFGIIDWDAANAIGAPSAIYLQNPGLLITNRFFYAELTLLPFLTSRHAYEVVYSVDPSYNFPVKNELTPADITASGATVICITNGTDVMPACTFKPLASGTVTFVALSADGLGHFSAVQPYSKMSTTLTLATACHP